MKTSLRPQLSQTIKIASLVKTGLVLLVTTVLVITSVYIAATVPGETPEIFLRSWESKTIHGQPVYNTIKLIKKKNKDIWMMNQSHVGLKPMPQELDRLAIVVQDQVASFYQLPPGSLEWSENLLDKKIDLKVNCMQCHSNGPRAIRAAPDYRSLLAFKETTNLFFMNLKIKFYGKIKNQLWMAESEFVNTDVHSAITSKTCLRCHNDGQSPFGRSALTLQQRDTIRFLIDQKQMPPPGFSLSEIERSELEKQISR